MKNNILNKKISTSFGDIKSKNTDNINFSQNETNNILSDRNALNKGKINEIDKKTNLEKNEESDFLNKFEKLEKEIKTNKKGIKMKDINPISLDNKINQNYNESSKPLKLDTEFNFNEDKKVNSINFNENAVNDNNNKSNLNKKDDDLDGLNKLLEDVIKEEKKSQEKSGVKKPSKDIKNSVFNSNYSTVNSNQINENYQKMDTNFKKIPISLTQIETNFENNSINKV